jgi:hypothetical protein
MLLKHCQKTGRDSGTMDSKIHLLKLNFYFLWRISWENFVNAMCRQQDSNQPSEESDHFWNQLSENQIDGFLTNVAIYENVLRHYQLIIIALR